MKITVWTFGWDTTADGIGSAAFGTEKEAWAEYIERTFNTKFGGIDETSDEYPRYQEAQALLEEEDFGELSDLLSEEADHMATFSGPDSQQIEVPADPRPRIIVVIEGGAMRQVLSSTAVDVALIDYDTDGCDDEQLMRIPQGEDKFENAVGYLESAEINPERIKELFPIVAGQDAYKWGWINGKFACPSCGREYEREGKPAKDTSYNALLEIYRLTGHCCEDCATQIAPAVPVELTGLVATVNEAEMARYDAQLPPDPEKMNESRAGWAEKALRAFQHETRTDDEDVVMDLLCDIAHWCDRNGQSMALHLRNAIGSYGEETESQGKQFKAVSDDN